MDIKIKIVPNPLYGRPGSLVECEYMGQVIHTGTATAADVCEACKQENPQMTEPLASLATETIMDYGSDKVVTDVVRFNLGSPYFTMEPAVSGSVPTVDAPLTDANERYIKVVNGQSLNARIAALRPVIDSGDLGDVQFRSTEATHGGAEHRNTVFGGEEFVALGKRLGGADQEMKLVAADGTVASTATFVEGDALGQRFTYRLATPPAEDGAYTLVLTSTGKDTPDRNPKTIPVKVAFVAPPVPGPVVTDTHSDQEAPGESCKVTVTGSNLRFAEGADPAEKVFFRDGDEGEEETIVSESYLETPEINDDGTKLTFRLVSGQWGPGDHTIHLRLEMVDAEGNPVSVDAGTFEFSGT